jgi:hypothetical protein
MLFANYADALSSMFYAFEKMEYPAGLTNAVALLKVTLGALVLLLPWGFVGLAGVALAVNIVQSLWLYGCCAATLSARSGSGTGRCRSWMLRQRAADDQPPAGHHLLAHRRVDSQARWPVRRRSGIYSIGLKYMDGLNIIPSGLDHGHLPADEPLRGASRTACCAPTWSACAC